MNGENVGMVERGHGPRLLLEAAQAVGFAGEGFRKNFQSDIAPQARISCAINLAHAACAERREDFVGTEFCTRAQCHARVIIACAAHRTRMRRLWMVLSSNPYLGIIGKGGHIRTIPVPEWVKATVDSWTLAASINAGPLLRSINKAGKLWGRRTYSQSDLGNIFRIAVSIRHVETHYRAAVVRYGDFHTRAIFAGHPQLLQN